jgi:hypothetical protein
MTKPTPQAVDQNTPATSAPDPSGQHRVAAVASDTEPAVKASYDSFDPANLRVNQNFIETAGVKKVVTSIPVRRPDRQTFFRIHPKDSAGEWRDTFHIIDLKNDREEYIVAQKMVHELAAEWVLKQLRLGITMQGDLFLMPLRLAGADGRDMEWWSTLRDHCDRAETTWVRVMANQRIGAYDVWESIDPLPEPAWEEVLQGLQFWDLIKIAFKKYLIEDANHAVVKRLRGRV